jgi:hypothetical protein
MRSLTFSLDTALARNSFSICDFVLAEYLVGSLSPQSPIEQPCQPICDLGILIAQLAFIAETTLADPECPASILTRNSIMR